MPSILVVGFHEHESGKTIFTGSLVSILRRQGFNAIGVKPVAGVNIWESPWVIDEMRKKRLVVSGDAIRLYRASGDSQEQEVINPLTVIYAPLDPNRSRWKLLSSGEDVAVLGRISSCKGNRVNTLHFINVEGLDLVPPGVASTIVDTANRLNPHPLRVTGEFVERVLTGEYIPEVESCMSKLLSQYELIIYESNSDVAVPTPSSLGSELVLVVGKSVVGVVEGERWSKAVEVLVGSGGLRNMTVRDVIGLTGVSSVFYLPFLPDPIEGYSERDLENILKLIMKRLLANRHKY